MTAWLRRLVPIVALRALSSCALAVEPADPGGRDHDALDDDATSAPVTVDTTSACDAGPDDEIVAEPPPVDVVLDDGRSDVGATTDAARILDPPMLPEPGGMVETWWTGIESSRGRLETARFYNRAPGESFAIGDSWFTTAPNPCSQRALANCRLVTCMGPYVQPEAGPLHAGTIWVMNDHDSPLALTWAETDGNYAYLIDGTPWTPGYPLRMLGRGEVVPAFDGTVQYPPQVVFTAPLGDAVREGDGSLRFAWAAIAGDVLVTTTSFADGGAIARLDCMLPGERGAGSITNDQLEALFAGAQPLEGRASYSGRGISTTVVRAGAYGVRLFAVQPATTEGLFTR